MKTTHQDRSQHNRQKTSPKCAPRMLPDWHRGGGGSSGSEIAGGKRMWLWGPLNIYHHYYSVDLLTRRQFCQHYNPWTTRWDQTAATTTTFAWENPMQGGGGNEQLMGHLIALQGEGVIELGIRPRACTPTWPTPDGLTAVAATTATAPHWCEG
jgi:hypothetical protein